MVDKKYRPGGKSYLCVNDDSKLVVNAKYLAGLKERQEEIRKKSAHYVFIMIRGKSIMK